MPQGTFCRERVEQQTWLLPLRKFHLIQVLHFSILSAFFMVSIAMQKSIII